MEKGKNDENQYKITMLNFALCFLIFCLLEINLILYTLNNYFTRAFYEYFLYTIKDGQSYRNWHSVISYFLPRK